MRVINECRVEFMYRLSSQAPIAVKTILSNVVSTDIVKDILKIEKYVDKECTYSFDILTYTIIIYNISNAVVTNLFFQDSIPVSTIFIENSVEINHIKKGCINPKYGFYIGNISPGCHMSIRFKVVVLPLCFCKTIKNYSIIEHDYIYNVERGPTRVPIKSNIAYTKIKNKVFKQLQINKILIINESIYNIIDSKINIEILEIKVVNTPTNDIYGKCKSNICTLIVIGSVKYEIFYNDRYKNKFNNSKVENIKSIKDIFGFSCYMLVPVGITYLNKNNLNLIIEHISTNLINKNTIFINVNILLCY